MHSQENRKHIIDKVFPLALFFVFAVSSVCVILMASNSYQRITKKVDSNYESRTVLSYIVEKVHQGDEGGGVFLGTLDGLESLVIEQDYSGQRYLTYIYEDSGVLRELFLLDGTEASAADGREIMKVHHLKMEQIEAGRFRFSCGLEDGKTSFIVVSVLSE